MSFLKWNKENKKLKKVVEARSYFAQFKIHDFTSEFKRDNKVANFNPFSLSCLNTLKIKKVKNYNFSLKNPSLLLNLVQEEIKC